MTPTQDEIYQSVEKFTKKGKLMEKRYGVESFNEGEPYFTTSQETDIWEMIREGMTVGMIISEIKKW